MANKKPLLILLAAFAGVVIIALLVWQILSRSGSPVETAPFEETFDSAGTWMVGEGAVSQGEVKDGVYEMFVELMGDVFWVTAGRNFSDGVYEVEATPLDGAVDNGYGMLFHVDQEEESFYVFKVSSDGYVFIGRCSESCAEAEVLVDRDWFPSTAVNQGLEVTNKLRVVTSGPEMTFYVNDTEVGQATDEALTKGDIGLLAETFTPGGLRVVFDNFKVTPLETN